MSKISILPLFFAVLSFSASAQVTYTWTPVPMDSTWNEIKDRSATDIIEKYAPQVASLQEIIAYSDAEYDKARPESGLSDFAADVIREMSGRYSGENVDVALANFGGIRTSIPKGAVRVYDIYSIFPFDNNLVWFDIKGSDLKKFLNNMIYSGRIEALSGVTIVANGRKPVSVKVGGKTIDENRYYRFATINFLLDGGDGVSLRDVAQNLVSYDKWYRDAIVEYLRDKTSRNERLVLSSDGRVIINETEQTK